MSIALVDNVALSGPSTQVSGNRNCLGSTILICTRSFGIQGHTGTPSDDQGNTWVQPGTGFYWDTFYGGIELWYVENPTVSATQVFTSTYGLQYMYSMFSAYSGVATVSPLDTSVGQSTSSAVTTYNSGAVTPSVSGCLLVTAVGAGLSSGSFSIDNSFSIVDSSGLIDSTSYGGATAWKEHTSGAITPGFTWSGATDAAAGTMAFKPAAAAAAASGDTLLVMGV